MTRLTEPAPAKLNLALHVRGKRPDGHHDIETVFAFCIDGDTLHAEPADALSLAISGPFAGTLSVDDNLVIEAARALLKAVGIEQGARLHLVKALPVASGIGGGSADAAAALRLLTRLWALDPKHASRVAPTLGADVPACLLSLTARGEGVGEALSLVDGGVAGVPVLLVNPLVALPTGAVFAGWDGIDRGALDDWRSGRNDLMSAATGLVPEIGDILDWLGKLQGASAVRMSGSGATCFAMFVDEAARDAAVVRTEAERGQWWHMASVLR